MKQANVFIIGGGVIGASIAFHLAAKGLKKIVVVDKNPEPRLSLLGNGQVTGSTGRATGGFRCQFATAVNIKLSLLSREKLLNFRNELGVDPGFLQAGYLFIASTKTELEALYKLQEIQKANGVYDAEKVGMADISKLNPFLIIKDDIMGGAFSASDGFIKPLNIFTGYKSNAEKFGVEFHYGEECFGFKKSGNKIVSVSTSAGDFKADFFVNAAGAWAGILSEKAGLNIPVVPMRREIAVLNEKHLFSEDMPMTIFINDGFHFRQREGHVLLLYPEINSCSPFDMRTDDDWLAKVKAIADERIKDFTPYSVNKEFSWGGLYEVSPDKHSILGLHPLLNNFYLANGSSGHGVMHSPAIGEIISEMIVNGSFTKFDIHPLRPTRFEENDLNFCSEYL